MKGLGTVLVLVLVFGIGFGHRFRYQKEMEKYPFFGFVFLPGEVLVKTRGGRVGDVMGCDVHDTMRCLALATRGKRGIGPWGLLWEGRSWR